MEKGAHRKIGIIRGGKKHYNASLKEGSDLIAHVFERLSHAWKPIDIFIDKNGAWHARGVPASPENFAEKADVFWDTTRNHEHLLIGNVPVVNASGGIASLSISGRKMFEESMKEIGVRIPRHILIPEYQQDIDGPLEKFILKKSSEIFEKFSPPWQVRLYPGSAKEGARLVRTFPELSNALADGVGYGRSILIEEYVGGEKIQLHSVAGFRGQETYVFPPTEGRKAEKEKAVNLAKSLHKYVPAPHYLFAQFVFHPKRGVYLEELEFSPDLDPQSHFAKACASVGAKMHHVIEHILGKAKV
ncbi:MAG TPA: hypothetical protein VFQ59_00400 [Candidatus Paceibacterota bacterium]|nr:hypothetical protein [Candidatus Paceibacterota bacterium]